MLMGNKDAMAKCGHFLFRILSYIGLTDYLFCNIQGGAVDLSNNFIKAFTFGIMLAAPVGPMALLTIRTTMCSGSLSGLSTGIGAATGDALYAMVSFLGIASVTTFFSSHQFYIQLTGCMMMIAFAIYLFVTQRSITEELVCGIKDHRIHRYLKLFGTSVALALANPPTISIFIAGSSMLKIFPGNITESLVLALTVWTASALWYVGVVYVIFYLRARSTLNFIRYLNVVSIIFLLLFSAWNLVSIF